MTRPKPDPETQCRADLGELIVYALDVYRVTRTPDGEIAHLYEPDGPRILRSSVSDIEIDNGRGAFSDDHCVALAEAWGVAPDDVEMAGCILHESREWAYEYKYRERCFDAEWCRKLHGCFYATAGRLSADVLALLSG